MKLVRCVWFVAVTLFLCVSTAVATEDSASFPEGMMDAYLEIVQELQSYPLVGPGLYDEGERHDWNDYWDFGVALYDVSGDGVPELFASWVPDMQREAAWMGVWTCEDGQARQVLMEYVMYLGPGEHIWDIDTVFFSTDGGLYLGQRDMYPDGGRDQRLYNRYIWENGGLILTDDVEMIYDEVAFDRAMEEGSVDWVGAYYFPWHNGARMTMEEFQAWSVSVFGSVEVILFGDSWDEPKVTMSYTDAIVTLGGDIGENTGEMPGANSAQMMGAVTADAWRPITARLNQKMSTRSGPGTMYTEELGTFKMSTEIVVFQQEQGGSVPWGMVEFTYQGGLYRAYTGMKRIDTEEDVPWADDNTYETTVIGNARAFYGPGEQYVPRDIGVSAGTAVWVCGVEQGYALIEYDESSTGRVRAWVPVSALEASGMVQQPPVVDGFSQTPTLDAPMVSLDVYEQWDGAYARLFDAFITIETSRPVSAVKVQIDGGEEDGFYRGEASNGGVGGVFSLTGETHRLWSPEITFVAAQSATKISIEAGGNFESSLDPIRDRIAIYVRYTDAPEEWVHVIAGSEDFIRDGIYMLALGGTHLFVDAQNGGTENGTRLQIWENNASPAQQWRITHLGNGVYSVVGMGSGKAMEIMNSSTDNGAIVQLFEFDPSVDTMKWRIVRLADNEFKFVNAHSGLCLDVTDGNVDYGVLLHGWEDNGTATQRFSLVPMPQE